MKCETPHLFINAEGDLTMTDQVIPQFDDLDELMPSEQAAIMIIKRGDADTAPVEHLLRRIFVYAIVSKSSDIHISGRGDRDQPKVYINVRGQGGLINQVYAGKAGRHFEAKLFQLTATAQGGSTPEILSTRFSMELPAHYAHKYGLQSEGEAPYAIDIRVQYVRTYDGYAFTCRLLDQQRAPKLHELGLSYSLLRAIKQAVNEPSGLILVSGPTGSGKTTLLNAVLGYLNNGQRSILTIENPVEFRLTGEGPIKQVQVQGDITFARALRAGLRCDPDIILIGEIRDEETMEIALQAAQTGHLVLATIHANSGSETISRALDLTVDKRRDAYRLAETLKFVMAQRLLDKYTDDYQTRPFGIDEVAWLSVNGIYSTREVRESKSDIRIGKIALIEAITVDDQIKNVIRSEHLSVVEIYRLARDQLQYESLAVAGMRSVETDGCRIRDCMTRLESATDALEFPGLRQRLARVHDLSLAEVARKVDSYCQAHDQGIEGSLDSFFSTSKVDLCAAV